MRRMRKLFLFLVVMILPASPVFATHTCTTCYISQSGSDANSGATKLLSWLHAPGMLGATGNASTQVPAAGDSYIFKGGDTWGNANFQWVWTWSGSAGNPIYIGVDQTWFTGGSYARPIFNGGGTVLGSVADTFMKMYQSYVTIDGIEWTGLYWNSVPSSIGYIDLGSEDHTIISNNYFHNWSHDTYANGARDNCNIIAGSSPTNTGQFSYNIVDGSPGSTDSCYALYHFPNADHNIVKNVSNGLVYNKPAIINDNIVGPVNLSFDSGQHDNCLESAGGSGTQTDYVYNNIFHDCSQVSVLMPGTGSGENFYFWNNVLYTSSASAPIPIQIDSYSPPANISAFIYNNTISTGPTGNVCIRVIDRGFGAIGTLDMRNNFCVGTGSFVTTGPGAGTLINTTNIVMTPTQATAASMTSAQPYAYQPLTFNCAGQANCPVGAGTNEAALATGSLSSMANDTDYACTIGAGNVVTCPAKAVIVRPPVAVWDAGAYQYLGALAIPTRVSIFAGM